MIGQNFARVENPLEDDPSQDRPNETLTLKSIVVVHESTCCGEIKTGD